jgi:hypothetical protein
MASVFVRIMAPILHELADRARLAAASLHTLPLTPISGYYLNARHCSASNSSAMTIMAAPEI